MPNFLEKYIVSVIAGAAMVQIVLSKVLTLSLRENFLCREKEIETVSEIVVIEGRMMINMIFQNMNPTIAASAI